MMEKNDKPVFLLLSTAFVIVMLWGYISGDFGKLFRHRDPQEAAAAEQQALEHLFGSDRLFDSSADDITSPARASRDSVAWKTLAHAQMKMEKGSAPISVTFAEEVQELDGTPITITGYIFPLQASSEQAHFLLSAYPPSCPYCLPGGPTELIEVTDSEPVKFTYDPITIRGTLHLLKGEALKDGMCYRMSHITRKEAGI